MRRLDIFYTPVGVRYKSDKHYKTFCGGVSSIMALVSISFLTGIVLYAFITGDTFNESTIEENLKWDSNRPYVITDREIVVAFQFVDSEA